MFWVGTCVIVSYLKAWVEEHEEELRMRETVEREIEVFKKRMVEQEVTAEETIDLEELRKKILEIPEEELVEEIIGYAKEEYEKHYAHLDVFRMNIPMKLHSFLIKRLGLSEDSFIIRDQLRRLLDFDDEIHAKLSRVVSAIRHKLEEEERRREIERLTKEKEMLPKLVEECVKWAKALGLTYLKKEHVRTFLAEKNIELSPTILDALHSTAYRKLLKKS